MNGAGGRIAHADWETRLRSVATGLGLALGGLVAATVFGMIAVSLLVGVGVPVLEDLVVRYLVGTVTTGAGFAAVVAVYLAATDQPDLLEVEVPSLRDLGWVVAGLVALIVALVVVSVVVRELGLETAQHRISEIGSERPELLLYMLPLAFLVIGPTEELLFRGAIQGVLRRAYRPAPAIAIASLLFAVGHFVALTGEGRWTTIAVILLLGAILGALYEYTDNLVVPALVHGGYDAIAFVQIYVSATGVA